MMTVLERNSPERNGFTTNPSPVSTSNPTFTRSSKKILCICNMEITLQNSLPVITSEKRIISFLSDSINIDGMKIDFPGEYEKSGFGAQVVDIGGTLVYELQIEGRTIAFLPNTITEGDETLAGAFHDIDLLLIHSSKESVKLVELLEPRMVVPYGENIDALLLPLGQGSLERVDKYKTKEVDFEGENVVFVKLSA
jgi:hypothetical protein